MDRFDLDPRNPIYDLPYDPKGGSGIINAKIWVNYGYDWIVEKLLAYQWYETVNGIEVEVEKPIIPFATALEEDIYNAMKQELNFDHITYITK